MAPATRDHFSSRLGVLAATLGSAVGLGNIWKFPSLVGQNGGASFLVVYLLASLCIGLPLMISDLSLGRAGRSNVISIFQKLAPRTGWWLIGLSAIISCLLILGFYSDVAGWVFAYILKSATGTVSSTDPAAAQASFSSLLNDGPVSLFWQWLVLMLTGAIIMRGASAGIEKVTRVLMPVLFLLLVGVCIRSLTLPGASEGLRFLFMPQWERVDASVIMMAMGLAFFKMSLGMGCMLTYGSYFKEDVNIPLMATRVMICDLLVSLLAGIAIFPAVFSFGFQPAEGPALLFLTIPAVFSSMPGGTFFATLFFILSAIAHSAGRARPAGPAGDPLHRSCASGCETVRPDVLRPVRCPVVHHPDAVERHRDEPVRGLFLGKRADARRPGGRDAGQTGAGPVPYGDAGAHHAGAAARSEHHLR